MNNFPEKIENEQELEEVLSRPSKDVVELMAKLDGDFLFLGVAGKIGPSLAHTVKRACTLAGMDKRIVGVSRFSNPKEKELIESFGVETISGDLLDRPFLESLPRVKNVFFLAGMKFGSEENRSLTWAMNSYLPALVSEYFNESRIVAYSTGCVYPLVPVQSGGSREFDDPVPVGEYAQSCLGRERMFEYGSRKYKNPVAIIRLNYAVEPRYGVLVDIGLKVYNNQSVDLIMGHFNAIWQGDANNKVIQSLEYASCPPWIANLTGVETLSVREVALQFGKLLDREVRFTGKEASTALLSNSEKTLKLLGKPEVPVSKVIEWTAHWIKDGNRLLDKPTHFEVRDGKY